MKEITKSNTHLQQVQPSVLIFIVFLLFTIWGSYCVLAGLQLLPLPSQTVSSPLWEVVLFGCYIYLAILILFVKCILFWSNKRKRIFLAKRYQQPWYLDYKWNPEGIDDNTAGIWKKSLFGVFILSMIVIPLNWYTFSNNKSFGIIAIVTAFFDIFMLVALGSLVYYIMHAVKYGKTRLTFAKFPFFPGEKLTVTFSPNLFSKLHCTLRFVEERLERTKSVDKEKEIVCYELYNEQQEITCSPKMEKVPIKFNLPVNSEWTNQLQGTHFIKYWELEVEAEHPGIDFHTTFLLPVYDDKR